MTIHSPLLRSVAVGLALLGLAGCDATDPLQDVELHVQLDGATVDIPASVGTVDVLAGQATVSTGSFTNDTDIDRIEDLQRVTILPSYLTFSPAAAGAAADGVIAAQSGTIEVLIFIDGLPHPGTPIVVTIVDDVVTAVQPQSIEFDGATIDVESYEAFLASVGVSVPVVNGWQDMTISQVEQAIMDALASSTIEFSIGVTATGDLDGSLRLSQLSFDAEAVFSQ